jgi:hypothetical protein
MKRTWIAMVLLAGSWLFGLSYYHAANGWLWAAAVAGAVVLLSGTSRLRPRRPFALAAIVLLLPALWVMRWPFKAVPLLVAGGLALHLAPIPVKWPRRLGTAMIESGLALFVQGVTIQAYEMLTARSHELPALLARLTTAVANLLSVTVGYNGGEIALFSMRKVHLLAASAELLLDPWTLCLLTGSLALLFLRRARPRVIRGVVLIVVFWLPVRAGLLMAVMMHRALVTDYDSTLKLMEAFWSAWVLLPLLAVPALVAMRLAPAPVRDVASPIANRIGAGRVAGGLALLALAAALLAAGLYWDPVGQRKAGRVLVDEHHSTWEPTQRPFDTEWYGHDAGYNYACIYDYASRFYDMSRLTNRIDDAALSECDVLILKVPTSAYAPEELNAVDRFVEQGGGVMLVGEHTDVFLTSTHLNQVARRYGFEFRPDCLFGIDSAFDQLYKLPPVPHPMTQHMPPMEFAVSCSIAPTSWRGRAAIRSTGLWSLPAFYYASNFYPQVEDRADMRYGAFVQLGSARRGKGRVVAFTDSTIFSNFSTFEPGKSELMLGMIEWLNHGDRLGDPRIWLLAAAAVAAIAGLVLARRGAESAVLLAVVLAGWSAACCGIRAGNRRAMPLPEAQRPYRLVTIDRTLSEATLSKCGFIKATPEGFGIFEQWILKLGYFTSRRQGEDIFKGDLALFLQPRGTVSDAFRSEMVRYVEEGGHVLVIDSALNKASTSNRLLHPFKLSFDGAESENGELAGPSSWPVVPVEDARIVRGGTPLATVNDKIVAAVARHGKGTVTLIGFGARFNDDGMGITTDIEPGEELRKVFEVEFQLVRSIIEGTLPEEEERETAE